MYPLDIPGLTREGIPVGNSVLDFLFSNDANEQTIVRLVSELPPDSHLMFYDGDYPSPSDPGAFVTIKRDNDQYTMRRSNHGWSKNWASISFENLVAYLSKCTNYNMGPDSMRRMRWYTVPPLPPKKWWQFWK